jgi:hypothetical protein
MIPTRFARGDRMKRFVEGADRVQPTLFPECLEDWIGEDNPVRVIDVFVDELEMGGWRMAGSLIFSWPDGGSWQAAIPAEVCELD